jgi:hypothetical protein
METNTVNSQWTDETILDLVRKLRNELIKDFLDERILKEHVSLQFGVKDLSNIRIEFIKKDLRELLISPVDTRHYDRLITQIRMTDSAALTVNNDQLFYKELDGIIRKNLY